MHQKNRPVRSGLKVGTGEKVIVGLSYDGSGSLAPVISALGRGEMANLLEIEARRYGVPIVTDKELASELGRTGLNREISETTYFSVAEHLVASGVVRRQR